MIPDPSFLASLANAAARSILLAGVVGCGLWLLRVRNVVAQKAAWILVLLASLLMPLVARWAAHIPWLPDSDTFVVTSPTWPAASLRNGAPPIPAAKATIAPEPNLYALPRIAEKPAHAADLSRFPVPTIARVTQDTAPAAPARTSTPFIERVRAAVAWLTPARALLLVYLAVAGALLFRLGFGAWAALCLWRRARPVAPGSLAAFRGIPVRSSRAIASPITVAQGIVLPADYAAWDAEKLRIVLAHEGSHVRQRDFVLQLAASLHIALFWFNPLAWWLKRKLSRLSETISDGAAVHQAASHACYAQVLLEFAALPRPIPIGVAMAHRGHLRSRIEHLLNENSFRQAFSGGRARLAAAVLLVPVALFAATAMVRVQATGQQAPPAPTPDATPAPQAAPSQAAPTAPANPAPPPNAPADIAAPPSNPIPSQTPPPDSDKAVVVPDVNSADGPGVSMPPGWPEAFAQANAKAFAVDAKTRVLVQAQIAKAMALNKQNFFRDGFRFFNDGNSYAYVTGQGESNTHFSGNWYDGSRDEIEKARKVAHGNFLWFERDGKSYVIDDAATLAPLKPMQDQMDELGKQQDALGKQQEELGKQQEELGKQMEQLKVPTPDMKKEIADLQAVEAKLAAIQGKDASQQQLGDIESELGDIQGRIGGLQGQASGRMGDLGGKMGELGGQQGKLGAEQGRLGAQQGRLAREMDGKALTIIDESLKDGKARPVQ